MTEKNNLPEFIPPNEHHQETLPPCWTSVHQVFPSWTSWWRCCNSRSAHQEPWTRPTDSAHHRAHQGIRPLQTAFQGMSVHQRLIIIITIITKNFNRRNSHGHHGSKCHELAQHALTWIARMHSHTYINTVTITWCEVPAQLLQNLELNLYLKVPEGLGEREQTGVPREKKPTACPLIGITY